MNVRVLGSAAGGAFPQWNCGCANCRDVRAGACGLEPRSHESIAVAASDDAWVLVNATPDVRHQIERCPALHPRGPRDSPIAAIVLTNADLDHCLGLLSLREWQPLVVHATERVRRAFCDGNSLARALDRFPGQVVWRRLELDRVVAIEGVQGATGLEVEAVPVPGKPPLHREGESVPHAEDNVGLLVRAAGREGVLAYFPACAAITPRVRAALDDVHCVFFDGTFWSGDELTRASAVARSAAAMAHLPVGGTAGSLAALSALTAPIRLFTHLNNTQPLLRDGSPERAAVRACGWDVAVDGMEIAL